LCTIHYAPQQLPLENMLQNQRSVSAVAK
jgi:hypothetical protein